MSDSSSHFENAVQGRLSMRDTARSELESAILIWGDQMAIEQARALDAKVERGETLGPLAGLIMSIKANVDVAGWPTTAGSKVLRGAPVASRDAPLVASLREAGAIILAQTNMVEFAYGALGQNSCYGTPRTPVYPDDVRLPGGSSSGAGVTVAVGLVDAAVGTDTSGSVRIPAAFCGVVGFKPTQGRYSEKGIVPLALTLDTAGFLAGTVAACDLLDAAVTKRSPDTAPEASVAGLRFIVPRDFVDANAEPAVLSAFNRAIAVLVAHGASVEDRAMAYLADAGRFAREGGIVSAESYVWHQRLLETSAALYDPRVGPRIAGGKEIRAGDYVRARERLSDLAERYEQEILGYDAVLMPTNPIEPPRLSSISDEDDYLRINMKAMQFTEFANRINVPSLTIPLASPGRAIGLMANGGRGSDVGLLRKGRLIESCLRDCSIPREVN